MGDFFKCLDRLFRSQGARTFRIGFNVGDRFFSYGDNYTPYRGKPGKEWKEYIDRFLTEHKIDKIFLFGDCRHYQSIAIRIAMKREVEVFVFEEGYVRPHYVTMERWGVNDFSRLSRDPSFYRSLPEMKVPTPIHAHASKTKMVYSASLYYALSNLFHFRYPHYRHHRDFSALKEAFHGIRGALRKLYYPLIDRRLIPALTGPADKRFYFVPLQTHNDFQILQHSEFRSIEKFIITVLESFARHAPKDTWLLLKHHPVDRGRKNYHRFIFEQAELLDIARRVMIAHDLPLPVIFRHTLATVTVNSTVGLTSIAYGVPTLTLGRAVYDMPGLTNAGKPLDRFWNDPEKPDPELYRKFHAYIVDKTQLNGSFYGRMPVEFEEGTIFEMPEKE
jgi:capsular polysaccharide export protein